MRSIHTWLTFFLMVFCASAFADATIGEPPPDTTLGVTTAGKAVKPSDFPGRVVVVSFWASWCGPCRKELPILENLQELGKGQIQVVAVNVEESAAFRRASQILKSQQMLLVNDSRGISQRVYRVKSIPHMVLIGRDGRILDIHSGYAEQALTGIVKQINDALAAKTE